LPPGIVATREPGEYRSEKDGTVLVFVPGGVSRMGSDEWKGARFEDPVHEVDLAPFLVGKLEVTNDQFAAFVRATGFTTDAERSRDGLDASAAQYGVDVTATWKNPYCEGRPPPERHPVVRVSWFDAQAYARWAGLELPSEAQWERAASWDPAARRQRRFAWGDVLPPPGPPVANLADESFSDPEAHEPRIEHYRDGFDRLAPVGSFPAGASPVGALDMTGNAYEWCLDGFDQLNSGLGRPIRSTYPSGRVRDPFVPPGTLPFRIVRGGSYRSGIVSARCACRQWYVPSRCYPDVGFRLAWTLAREGG
jgi:iron(II)-dependent oxidoreductase